MSNNGQIINSLVIKIKSIKLFETIKIIFSKILFLEYDINSNFVSLNS
jgi:hypothetical protein